MAIIIMAITIITTAIITTTVTTTTNDKKPADSRRPAYHLGWIAVDPPCPHTFDACRQPNIWRMTMKKFLMVAALVASSASAWAHDHQGTNGGRVEDAGSYHVELVSKSEKVDLYISDANQKPIAATGFKAIGIFVVNGKAQRIAMEPAGSARLSGTASDALSAQPKGVVQLTSPDGKTVQAKFN
ncbi:hypothetical protein [Bradyrhizobium sp. AUGA SZCCT0182]|uniref:hypothetical protein n=2 Tax=unclassified Bradyrhizobium TaxID=2631580 RepID=UPI0020133EB9|nr:hypothetical protein [Bradyrhizobium sp. AUGA SZCCT0182]